MKLSAHLLRSLTGRRRRSIDPTRHFAVRIRNGYADPVSREQFLAAVDKVGAAASLLNQIATAALRQTHGQTEGGQNRLAEAIDQKLAVAQKIQSEFEAFVGQLNFSDQSVFPDVEKARIAMAEAIAAVQMVIATLNTSTHHRPVRLTQ